MEALRKLARLKVDVVYAEKLADSVEKTLFAHRELFGNFEDWTGNDERCGVGHNRRLLPV